MGAPRVGEWPLVRRARVPDICKLHGNASRLQYPDSCIFQSMFGPRISPLPADQLEAEHADLLERINRDATGASNVATMLLRHPLLFRLWAPLSDGLLYGSLSPIVIASCSS